MNSLEELDNKLKELRRTRDELAKSISRTAKEDIIEYLEKNVNCAPMDKSDDDEDEEDEDKKKDKKMIEEKLDDHNEKKHGEAKDKDTAIEKMDVKASDTTLTDKQLAPKSTGKQPPKNSEHGEVKTILKSELIKFDNNQQWDLNKSDDNDPDNWSFSDPRAKAARDKSRAELAPKLKAHQKKVAQYKRARYGSDANSDDADAAAEFKGESKRETKQTGL